MIKKIQKYLLLTYPSLWNLKIVPIGITVLIFNILFFLFGYISGKIEIQNDKYGYNENDFITFLVAGLSSLLTLVVWLSFYLKNNAFKAFYPKKSRTLYLEWFLTFIILAGTFSYSYSYASGINLRKKAFISKEQLAKEQKILNKVQILLPESDNVYYNRRNDYTEAQTKDSISISLLNYNYYYTNNESDTVLEWLKNNQKDSIRQLMENYMGLQKKYNLKTNLTVDSWMELVYNYPDFPVSPSNYISQGDYDYSSGNYFVEYRKISRVYDEIDSAFSDNDLQVHLLVTLYLALGCSLILLCFRVTSGKSLLWTFVVVGILWFVYGICTVILGVTAKGDINLFNFSIIWWVGLFILILSIVATKIYNKSSKGRSGMLLNIFFLLIPVIPYILYGKYMMDYNYTQYDSPSDRSNSIVFNFFNDNSMAFPWINLVFTVLIFILVMKMIKKWKALPEE